MRYSDYVLLLVTGILRTWGIHDTVADLLAHNEPFQFGSCNGYVHGGILRCAKKKGEQIMPHIELAHKKYPEYPIAVLGHSLGGGVSTLLALIIAQAHPEWPVHAYSFAPAAVLSLPLAEAPETKKVISSFVYNDDIVPRLSYGSLEVNTILWSVT